MTLLIIGVIVMSLIHLYPAVAPDSRQTVIQRLGANAYRGIFSLASLGALLLIIYGWKSSPPEPLYTPPGWGIYATPVFVLTSFILVFAPYIRTGINRLLRHPQLIGVVLWGAGHLLSNGETRSLVLFGGFGLWAVLQILLLNRRDGAWKKPEPAAANAYVRLVLIAVGVFAVVLYLHGWLSGVAVRGYY